MFGKLRRARHAEVPTQVAVGGPAHTTGTPPTITHIPVSFYLRERPHHTTKKAAITRLHVEHATLARLNNAAPVPRPSAAATPRRIARAAATASDRATVVLPPAMRNTPSTHEAPHGIPLGFPIGFPHGPSGPLMGR